MWVLGPETRQGQVIQRSSCTTVTTSAQESDGNFVPTFECVSKLERLLEEECDRIALNQEMSPTAGGDSLVGNDVVNDGIGGKESISAYLRFLRMAMLGYLSRSKCEDRPLVRDIGRSWVLSHSSGNLRKLALLLLGYQ